MQDLFDVSTAEVVERLKSALLPVKVGDYRTKPDFWGPFWVATTAIIFVSGTGNFGQLLETDNYVSDYRFVSIAAVMIYGTMIFIPLLMRALLYVKGKDVAELNWKEVVCVYGYSLSPIIPVSILCCVPLNPIRTLAVLMGLGVSCVFIFRHLSNLLMDQPGIFKYALVALPLGAQFMIALTYRIYFFTPH